MSGFEKWDIQDLTLMRYDTIKLVDEIYLSFPELFIIEKYVKIRSINRGLPYYFLEVKRSKIIRKPNKREQKFL